MSSESRSVNDVPSTARRSGGTDFDRTRSVSTLSSSLDACLVIGPGRTQATPRKRTGAKLEALTCTRTTGCPPNRAA